MAYNLETLVFDIAAEAYDRATHEGYGFERAAVYARELASGTVLNPEEIRTVADAHGWKGVPTDDATILCHIADAVEAQLLRMADDPNR